MLFKIVKKTASTCTIIFCYYLKLYKMPFSYFAKTGKKNIASEAGVYCLFDNRCYNNKPDSHSNWIPRFVTLPTKGSVGIFCTSGEITLSLCLTS